MTKDQLETVKDGIEQYLLSLPETVKKGNKYNCPLCGSGTGPKGTPAA